MSALDTPPAMVSAPCAICGDGAPDQLLYPSNFVPGDLNPRVFSARRPPDRIHYRMVRCEQCGLVRSDPVATADTLAGIYRGAQFGYGHEVGSLVATYGRALAEAVALRGKRGTLLEVGCGNGFLLETALDMGFTEVRGIEPSTDAVAQAPPRVSGSIICDVMRPGLIPVDSVDVICLFQVFDHVSTPGSILDLCYEALKPGGILLCFNHNVEAVSARVLRERSPIIDIEHTYLYSPRTLSVIVQRHRFRVLRNGAVRNLCSLRYLAHLLPLPAVVRRAVVAALRVLRLGGVRIWLPLGNLRLIAQKPEG